jgi:hypothetical protein
MTINNKQVCRKKNYLQLSVLQNGKDWESLLKTDSFLGWFAETKGQKKK